MTEEQRERLDTARRRISTLQNMGVRAEGYLTAAEQTEDEERIERLLALAEEETASVLKRKRH